MATKKKVTKSDASVSSKPSAHHKNLSAKVVATIFVLILVIFGGVTGIVLASPAQYRNPEVAHHHFRMQLFVEGEYIDFSQADFQEPYDPNQCGTGLTETPIHFHDGEDQMVHIHWSDVRGGDVLKYYGLNRLGGPDDSLGRRFDEGWFKPVPILGSFIPDSNKQMFVYEIKDGEIVERNAREFIRQDLETFFGKKSTLTQQREEVESEEGFGFQLIPKVLAHSDESKSSSFEVAESGTSEQSNVTDANQSVQLSEEERKELNDVLGDLIIYVQDDRPTNEEIKARLDKFVEIKSSTCGG